ncbi:MAG: DUF3943 domain-containing protein [Ignavibacteriaceae bacterium]|nr:DUF3943 domain-containing protein [Ignavibacteriaceae bacterium]
MKSSAQHINFILCNMLFILFAYSLALFPQSKSKLNFSLNYENQFVISSPFNFRTVNYPDSIDLDYISWEADEHFWVALSELAIIEFIPWALARWGREWEDPDDNWANVSAETWWRNITYGWEYDGDAFLTNYFAHPYHGNLYYNAGRVNGFSFWESSVWAFAGSVFWEYFGETFRPSINDLINTSMNGINLGEMLYRLSAVVTDNTETGTTRVFQEIGGTLLNPVRGFNRLLTGETSKLFPNPEEGNPKSFMVKFDGGIRRLDKNGNVSETEDINEGVFSAEILYGNLFQGNIKKPFSWFGISAAISSREPLLTNLQSFGNLHGWHLNKGKNTRHLSAITLNYNYFNNPGFTYGGTSVNPHIVSLYNFGTKFHFLTNLDIEFIAMGAVPTDYYVDVEGRNYDFGPGIGLNIGASITKEQWNIARLYYSSKWIWTQSEPSGSRHQLHLVWFDVTYPIINYLAVGFGLGAYWRNSYYRTEEDVFRRNRVFRLFLRVTLF